MKELGRLKWQFLKHLVPNSKTAVTIAKKNLSKINSFTYKKFFVIPKVKVEWKQGTWSGGRGRNYGGLYFTINGKPVRGWIMFDHAFFFSTKAETQKWLDSWLSERLTATINSIEPDASKDRAAAKYVVEKTYGVRIK